MGTKIKDIIVKKEIGINDLKNKTLVVDSYNILYQFLSTIRTRDGSLLMDSEGNVTSHLTGLFARTANLMQNGLKLAFVFDGKPPELKTKERQRRREAKEKASQEYELAKDREDIEGMKKYASRTSRLTPEMVSEAKKLISALGLPVIEAPSEGEAQAAFMVNKGDAYAEISQDYDCLMFGVPRLVRNLTVSERRKMPSKLGYQTIKPEFIELKTNLKEWGIDQDQLIVMGMLIGTDYNIGGIKGIGPKNAMKLVKQHKDDHDKLFKEVKWDDYFDIPWTEVYYTIKKIPTTTDYELQWKKPDPDKMTELLCEKHDFNIERVKSTLAKLNKEKEKQQQKGLGDFT